MSCIREVAIGVVGGLSIATPSGDRHAKVLDVRGRRREVHSINARGDGFLVSCRNAEVDSVPMGMRAPGFVPSVLHCGNGVVESCGAGRDH